MKEINNTYKWNTTSEFIIQRNAVFAAKKCIYIERAFWASGKEIGRIWIQLEEDGGGSTGQSWT